jgi:uncharacterized protein (UPF0218 family)
MTVAYNLTPELRRKLKEPIGTLIRGSFFETTKRFKRIVEEEKPPLIISVGDTVSRNLVENHLLPQLTIVDNLCMRRNVKEPVRSTADKTVRVKNPQATITTEAIEAIKDAISGNVRVKVIVEGEEDLLALIAVLHAPEGSYVLYGQPYEGIVAVKVTAEKQMEVVGILKQMETGSKS